MQYMLLIYENEKVWRTMDEKVGKRCRPSTASSPRT